MHETISFALGLGFLLGLKHATEADHLMAVTTIVSEHRSVWRAALVGAWWGLGHTVALLLAGLIVIYLRVVIPPHIATLLELSVALMIIALGSRVLYYLLRKQKTVHVHTHPHGDHLHTHLHFHAGSEAHPVKTPAPAVHTSHQMKIGWRPLLVGLVHGLAGSAALTLLVLAEIMRGGSAGQGMLYLVFFGIGSIGGMFLMSIVVSLPFVLTAARFERVHLPIQFIAGIGSILFGLYYAWEILSETHAG